ncbi:hypothetical protein M422DRAFT_277171 [Sphaerobolus stellatus SS14]|uniref:Uncharacterized protein n=1 Tax=Sphaerobolus stellatus (strain SS14) TaxID=990650 RepID=A0A0C9T130_SPHS4|nr:hypothetical protein M422DRAFT_277171 [Sphaerobolus stellatus SS14]
MDHAGNGWGHVGGGGGERMNRRRDDEKTNDISVAGDELQHEIGIRSNRRRRPVMIVNLIAAATQSSSCYERARRGLSFVWGMLAIYCPKRNAILHLPHT